MVFFFYFFRCLSEWWIDWSLAIPTSLPVSSARLSDFYTCITCILPQWLMGAEKHSLPDQGPSLPQVTPASTAVNWTACGSSMPLSTMKPSRSASQTSTLQSPSAEPTTSMYVFASSESYQFMICHCGKNKKDAFSLQVLVRLSLWAHLHVVGTLRCMPCCVYCNWTHGACSSF